MNTPVTAFKRYQRMRVALDGRPTSHLGAADKALVPVLAFPTLEMLTLQRMFANGKYNIVDRPSSMGGGYGSSQFQSQAYSQQQQQQGTSMYVLADAKLPGKAIKWRLFSPRSPARLDFLSPISAITAYTVSARSLKETGGFSDYEAGGATDSPQVVAAAPAGGAAAAAAAADKGGKGGKKGKKGGKPGSKGKLTKAQEREEQMAAMKAAALAQQSKPTDERQIFAVAASMTVSSGAQAEIRAEKVTLLPVGANSGVTSVILSLLLPGDLVVGAAGITGVKFEGTTVHFTGVLESSLKAPLLAMRALVSGLLSQEFVRVLPDSRKLTPLFLQLVRPLIKSAVKSYPTTDPPGFVRRKLNLLPPSNPRPTGMQERATAGMGAGMGAGGAAAAAVDQAALRFEQQRAQVLERAKARREAAAAAVQTSTPRPPGGPAAVSAAAAPAAAGAQTPAATLAAVQAQFANERAELLERMRTRKQTKPGSAQASAPASNSGSASARTPAPSNNSSVAAPTSVPAPVAAAAASPASSPSSSSSSPDLLSMLTRVWSSAPAVLTMNQLCVLFNNLHRTTWKAASGNKISMKEFIQRHPAMFKIGGQANEPTITFLQHSGAPSAEVKSPQPAQQNGQKPSQQQPKQQQQQQKPAKQPQQQQPQQKQPQKQAKQPKQQGKQQQQQQSAKSAAAPQAKQ